MKPLLEALGKYDTCPTKQGGCGADWRGIQRGLDNGGSERQEAQHLIFELTRGGCNLCVARWREVLPERDMPVPFGETPWSNNPYYWGINR